MSAQTWWFLCRASGIVAYLMLTASVLWGTVLASDLFPKWRRPAWLLSSHRWLAGLTVFFVAGHLAGLLADDQGHFRALDVLVPYASPWRPTAVAVGIVAVWLLLAVELTALASRRLPAWLWRGVHVVGYWAFWSVGVHAALSGTDASRTIYTLASLLLVAAVVFAATYRALTFGRSRQTPGRSRRHPIAEG